MNIQSAPRSSTATPRSLSSRTGKIARLPSAIRQQINLRLQEGGKGKAIVAWLNTLPEVQALVAAEFGGKPIREQNLSEWKQGGYRDWLLLQETRDLASHIFEDVEELSPEDRPALSSTLAIWVASRYAIATRHVDRSEGPEHWRRLREMCGDVSRLRTVDHRLQRLELEKENLEFKRRQKEASGRPANPE